MTAAAAYLSGVRDYRGYDETAGWRHGVAHERRRQQPGELHRLLGVAPGASRNAG